MRRIAIAVAAMVLWAPEAAEARSKAASYLMEQLIADNCPAGGTFDPSGIVEQDLTGDGASDLILDLHGLYCSDGRLAGGCGPAACNANIYVRQGGLLKLVTEEFSVGFTIGKGERPEIAFQSRRFETYRLRWNGRAFK